MTTESPVQKNNAQEFAQKALRISIKVLKVIWIPALLILALVIGLAVGYQFITKTPGSNIFDKEIWQRFFQQIRALRKLDGGI
jgi:ABC-type antimicrobial peptide transport system permease subunit